MKHGTPQNVFDDVEWLKEKQLGVPQASAFAEKMQLRGAKFTELPLTENELADWIVTHAGGPANNE